MNKNYKSTIVKKYGTDVEVRRYQEDSEAQIVATRVLLGRSTRTNTNLKASENQKEGIFLPDFDVDAGDFVVNPAHQEEYVVVTTHKEYDGNNTLSIVTNLMKCSHKMTLMGNTQIVDNRGNIKTTFGEKYADIPCYLEQVSSQLRQYEPGLSPDTEHVIYTTDLDMELTDQIVVSFGKREIHFKVVSLDYTSFPNLVVIEVARDIRE